MSRRRPTDFTSCTSWINRVKFIIQNMQIVPCPTIDGSSFVQLDEKGYNHYFNPHKQGLASTVCWFPKIPGCAGLWNFSGGFCWAFRATKTHQETPFLITNVSWEPYVPNIPPKNPIPIYPMYPSTNQGPWIFVPTSLKKHIWDVRNKNTRIGSEAWKAKNMWVVFLFLRGDSCCIPSKSKVYNMYLRIYLM